MPESGASFDVESIGIRNTTWNDLASRTPADYAQKLFSCSDAPGGGGLVYCDGVSFRPISRGLNSKIVTTGADGKVTWDYQFPFPSGVSPIVLFGPVNSAPQVLDVSLDGDPTNTRAKFMVRQSQPIPQNLIALLTGTAYNLFGGNGVSGVKIHATAFVPNNTN